MSASTRASTFDRAAMACLGPLLLAHRQTFYPLRHWDRDPVAYAYERLKVSLLMDHQVDVLRAICAGVWGERMSRVAVSSCQKAGKSATIILAALWFFECFADARVFMTAAIEAQTKTVLWHELGKTLRTATRAGVDVDGKLAASPAGGLVSSDGSREIRGITGRDIEAKAGLSGRMLFIIDEASALPERMSQVFDGNALGGGNLVFTSNPTQCAGPFFEAFNSRKEFWQTFEVSAFDVIAWQDRTGKKIEGTVDRHKVSEAEAMYGKDSPFYIVRVLGQFLRNETGRAIPLALIELASAINVDLEPDGPLSIGYDCAGPGSGGDAHAWYMTRGRKSVELRVASGADLRARHGLTEQTDPNGIEAAVKETLEVQRWYRRKGEVPRIAVDSSGPIGSVIFARLSDLSFQRKLAGVASEFFEVSGVNGGKTLHRNAKFVRVRDQLIWQAAQWLKEGGGLLKDHKLQQECHAQEWSSKPDDQMLAKTKDEVRREIGRSPDRFDAFCLSVFLPAEEREEDVPIHVDRRDLYEHTDHHGRGLDPYSGGSGFKR